MLGAATVLCVDKTGTLTENRMQVVETAPAVIDAAALACELEPFDPMDRAIVAACGKEALERRKQWTLERDYPFRETFLAMCHAWRSPEGVHVAVKGAPETVLALCGRQDLLPEVARAAQRGLRLLGVAEARWQGALPDDPARYPWRWLGFAALADPLRTTVPGAVALCRRAGIRVVMITGDHPGTALEIARQAGIAADRALTGSQIAAMDASALARAVEEVDVFARVPPEQKLRLVAAYKAAGEVVAMTGDGVNDAPALKAAHIGIAMGRRGTDVAREAAALVLLEDDFGSIVETARLGRRIYENIRNAMRYIISVHVPTAGMSFLPLAFGWPLPLFPVHIVFLEFVIDPACSIVFEAEASERDAMDRPPRDPRARLFDAHLLASSLLLGATLLAAVFALYAWAVASGRGEGEARALGFAAIVAGNLTLIFVNRSRRRTALEMLRRPNRALWWIVAGSLAALAAAIYLPPVAHLFRFAPPPAPEIALALAAGFAGVAWIDVWKARRRRAISAAGTPG
jgi:Ca2+-transporting ATPase